ncbi:ExeA family protein [Idiomarina sp. HP20-50]|uniref:ExeA family protein n=1 Tax=Idiomarina sp. HP20-50 TaxID=3070813 RepID=UPI00294AF45C|nr:AAA family ATPase [Idiomarina sp. HP20-50]MDV6315940.1 AAA family ATPase [Idiomarina sp. HP20-50]
MYLYHYGLRELPFTITPNTQFYYDLNSHHEAFEVVLTALKTGEGFIKVTGEVGTGKTLLCRRLLNDIPDFFKTAYIPDSYLNPGELRLAIAQELDVDTAQLTNQQQLARALQQRMLDINKNGQAVVLFIDEAQALPEESLEALRLLSNLETERRKLVHIVLLGQPELDERISKNAFRQLRQRISFAHKLTAMNVEETAEYIAHRMDVADYKGTPIFDWKLIKKLHRSSRGVPRLVNMLCHKMLLLAYGEGRRQLTLRDLDLAVKDTEDTQQPNSSWGLIAIVVSVFFLAAAAFSYWKLGVSI